MKNTIPDGFYKSFMYLKVPDYKYYYDEGDDYGDIDLKSTIDIATGTDVEYNENYNTSEFYDAENYDLSDDEKETYRNGDGNDPDRNMASSLHSHQPPQHNSIRVEVLHDSHLYPFCALVFE